ncbi:MAG: ABC transporter ATP-binding protein [Pseudomonadota bacterium]
MKPLIDVKNLSIQFKTDEGLITVVDDVSFSIGAGEVVGLVGESGSGKSVTAKALMHLNAKNAVYGPHSRITLHTNDGAVDVLSLRTASELQVVRGGAVSMIFQEPMASFAPAISIGKQMVEQLQLHTDLSASAAKDLSITMLDRVGIREPASRFNQYAFELSGGMRQRAMIAMALSTKPLLLIADEPTTALDVTIQAQVLGLMKDLVSEFGMGILFITHDLGVIAQVADRISVMYLGRIMETGPVRDVIRKPAHAYTRGLINALPKLDDLDAPLMPIPGDIPSPLDRPNGCVFHTRNPTLQAGSRYETEVPPLSEVSPGHFAALFPDDIASPVGIETPSVTPVAAHADTKPESTGGPLVTIDRVSVHYALGRRWIGETPVVKAVNEVSLSIEKGSFYGLVGESGSGKTTLGRAILRAAPVTHGAIVYDDGDVRYDVGALNPTELRDYRQRSQLIFQDPYAALSPRMTVRDIIAEPLEVMGLTSSRAETDERVRDIAAKCRLNLEHLRRFPHAFSGGQRQRISIARALVCGPKFVVADEAVAALDVSIQADILNLLKSLQHELDLTILFISHDLSVVAHVCDEVAVMYHGEIMEQAHTRSIFSNPGHAYTDALLSAIPSLDPDTPLNARVYEPTTAAAQLA